MYITLIISISVAAVLAVLLCECYGENRKLSGEIKRLVDINKELFQRIPVTEGENNATTEAQPLTIDKIAEAIRMEGFIPETQEYGVSFKAQGESIYVDTMRLPLFFLVKSYEINSNDWEMDILRDAANRMSEAIIMVKANITDDEKSLNFFVAAQDRNYESFRANLVSYLRIIEDGQRKMNEEYNRMVEEKRQAALAAQPVVPPVRQDTKVMS